MFRFLCPASFLCMLAAGALAQNTAPAAARGSLVIVGGALRPDNAAVWERIVQLAGGKGARIAVFASASAYPEQSGAANAELLRRYGAKPFVVPVAVKLSGTNYRQAAMDPALAKAVEEAGGAYFSGGDQGRITQALRTADGRNTRVLDALWAMYRRGGVIAGSSAGAAIMSSTMFYDAKGVLATLRQGVREGHEIAPGLGFIGDDVFVDQHLLVRGRFARMLPVMLSKHYRLGIGIDENTAAVVSPNREVEIIGYKGAIMLDLNRAGTDSTLSGFNVSNVSISYLDSGDSVNLATVRFTPSRDKLDGRLDPPKLEHHDAPFYADILGNSAVADLMAQLISSDQSAGIGIAFGAGGGSSGFEFRFSRAGESEGYASSTTDACSVYRLRLDVVPIVMQQPLYRYERPPALAGQD